MIIAKLMISAPSPKTRLDQGSEGHTLPDGEFETCRDPRCFSGGGLCTRKMSEKLGGISKGNGLGLHMTSHMTRIGAFSRF